MFVHKCFKCGKPINPDDKEVVFSFEWDAYCHKKCCPAFNRDVVADEECLVCDVYRRVMREMKKKRSG